MIDQSKYEHLANYKRNIYVFDSMVDRRKEYFPDFKEITFTGYKNPGFVKHLKEYNVKFDGSFSMLKLSTDWDGWWGFDDLLRATFVPLNKDPKSTSHGFKQLFKDPRGKQHSEWFVVTTEQLERVKHLAHLYGARERIAFSMITNGREAMGDYGVVVGYDSKHDIVEFVCPRCIDNHTIMSEFMEQPWDFLDCKDVVVIDPFGFTEPSVQQDVPGWPEIIAAAASFQEAGDAK